MSARNYRLFLLAGLVAAAATGATGCEITKVDCDKTPDEDICQDDPEDDGGDEWPDEEDAGKTDAGKTDAGKTDGGGSDAGKTDGGLDGSVEAGSDAGAGSDASTNRPLTITEFCESQLSSALAWRDAFDPCCPSTKPPAATMFLSGVVRYVEDAVGVCEMLRNAPIDAKKITYDNTKAAACADAYAKAYALPPMSCPAAGFDLEILEGMIGHGAPALAQISSCREAFKGSTKQGQPCTDQLECASGLRCAGDTGDKTCEAVVPSGGTCFGNAECADGLTCVGNTAAGGKQCREVGTSSAKCATSSECEVGLVCRAAGTNPAQCVTAKASTPVCVQ